MTGLILGIFAAAVTLFLGKPIPSLLIGSSFFLPVALILRALFWQALSQQEDRGTPKLFFLCEKDTRLLGIHFFFVIFPLASFALYAAMEAFPSYSLATFALWIVFLGCAFDLLVSYIKTLEQYLDPFFGLEKLEKRALASIANQDAKMVCEWIDLIGEAGFKAVTAKRSSLAGRSLDALQKVSRQFLAAAPTFSSQAKGENDDPLTYTLFYLFQRMDLLFEQSLMERQEALASQVVTAFGKSVIDCAKCDLSMASYPLHYLGRLGKRAQESNDEDLSLKINITLLEVAKMLLSDVNLSYGNLKEPFLNLIGQMHEMAKINFRKNKQTDISLLAAPFRELKEIFSKGKAASHQDTPIIVASLDQIISEFQALDSLLHTIPPIPHVEEEKKE